MFKIFFRSIFITLGILFGFVIGISLLILSVGLLNTTTDGTFEKTLSIKMRPDHLGSQGVFVKKKPTILEIDIVGGIGAKGLKKEDIRKQLLESYEGNPQKNTISAILLNINTPGGSVDDSDAIYRSLLEYKAQFHIPIYAYVEGMCASGGLYVACGADKVFATENSLVGSCGVLIMPFFNVSDAMQKVGIESKTISAGLGKDELNPTRKWKDGEGDSLKKITEDFYKNFVKLVTTHRPKVNQERLVNELGAQVFLAKEAQNIGFIDEVISSRSQVLLALAQEAKIADNYQVISFKLKNWVSELLEEKSPLNTGKLTHELKLYGLPDSYNPYEVMQYLYR